MQIQTDEESPGVAQWSTCSVNPKSRLDYWNELASTCFIPLAIDERDHTPFNGAMSRVDLGKIHISRIKTTPTTVLHENRHVASQDGQQQYFLLHLQVAGGSTNLQGGHEAVLRAGDCTLVDSTRPYVLRTDAESELLVCRLPADRFRKYLPYAPDIVAKTISREIGATRVLKGLFDNLWIEAQIGGNSGWLCNTDDCVMQAIELACRGSLGDARVECNAQQILARAARFIECNLLDPDLNVSSIAASLGITPRYLQKIFATQATTPTSYIQLQRLDMAKRLLARGDRSVTDVAYDVGFNDLSHFGRAFRRLTGVSPSKYRLSAN